MLVARYTHKKDLKAAIGLPLRYEETSFFGSEYKDNGSFSIVGSSAYDRQWYARVTMENGLIKKVV